MMKFKGKISLDETLIIIKNTLTRAENVGY